jgi:hypothetical protein
MCCGLRLLHGEYHYKTAETYFKDFATYFSSGKNPTHTDYPMGWAFLRVGALVFEHGTNYDIGDRIKDYIEKNGLGTVYVSEPLPNPVHGPDHRFRIFTWVHDLKALEKHCTDLLKPPETPAPEAPAEKAA